MLIDSERRAPHLAPPEVRWRREHGSGSRTIPKGFLQHRHVIPGHLLDCFEDIMELQATFLSKDLCPINFFHVDNMQASIESRLAYQGSACKALGPITECCRLAAYLTCFLSFTETWNNLLIPCRLSDRLRALLDNSLEHSAWAQHRALQTWLLLVGSRTATMDRGYVKGLKGRWSELLKRFTKYCSNLPKSEMNNEVLNSALEDFIYCDAWLRTPREIREWFDLELSFHLRCHSEVEEDRSEVLPFNQI